MFLFQISEKCFLIVIIVPTQTVFWFTKLYEHKYLKYLQHMKNASQNLDKV